MEIYVQEIENEEGKEMNMGVGMGDILCWEKKN